MAEHAIVDVRREAKSGEGRFVVQVTIDANGTYLRAEERNHDMEAAVDAVAHVLDRQAKRFKERKILRSERRVSKEDRLPDTGAPGATLAHRPRGPSPRRLGQQRR